MTCFRNEIKMGVTDFLSEIKHVENQSAFGTLVRVNQHESTETNYTDNILYN